MAGKERDTCHFLQKCSILSAASKISIFFSLQSIKQIIPQDLFNWNTVVPTSRLPCPGNQFIMVATIIESIRTNTKEMLLYES